MTYSAFSEPIKAFKKSLIARFGEEVSLSLFGSVARGEASAESDIDLLVLLPVTVTNSVEEEVFDLAFDVELRYCVVFGLVVYSCEVWNVPPFSTMPIHHVIEAEGILV